MPLSYEPVVRAVSGPYRGAALVGTYSAVIGWTFDDPALRKNLLGFAIRRTDLDPATDEVLRVDWLGGYKRFAETDNGSANAVRSLEAPFQRFRWNDYTLKAERAYRYEVFPMRGTPEALTRDEEPLVFDLRPSLEDPGDLGIFVNRGVTAAMAYLDRFQNRPPAEVGPAAYRWLSRGLKESLLRFIDDTEPGQTLHVAIYEFFDHEVAGALRAADDRNVVLHIVHDAAPGKHSTEKNDGVIEHFGLQDLRTRRTTVNISHNKVVIRLVGGVPKEVWAGSANFSENAFNFQTNTALVLRDPDVVKAYEEYFQGLVGNPSKAESKKHNRALMDRVNGEVGRFAEKTFFSPIRHKELLDCAAELASAAESAVLVSAPFGLDKRIVQALSGNSDAIIEYGLANATAQKKIAGLRRKNTRFFPPNRLQTYMGRAWDAKAFGAHKIHAKVMVVDPWSEAPKVLVGSANFSVGSCSDNDENALLVTGNSRLAAVLSTEFMRMYDHYKARFYIDAMEDANRELRKKNRKRKAQGLEPLPLRALDVHLKSDERWSRTAFDPDSPSHKYRDRIVFAGE